MILSEAVKKAGSKAELDELVDDGQVKSAEHNGIAMYFWPRVRFGTKDFADHIQEGSRGKASAAGTFAAIQKSTDGLGYRLQSSSSGGSSGPSTPSLVLSIKQAYVAKQVQYIHIYEA